VFVFEQAGKAAIPMLIFAGIPFLFTGPAIGIICWLIAAVLLVVLYTPVRGWLGIPPVKKASSETAEPESTVVRVRNSQGVTNIGNVGYGTDSVIDAEGVKDLTNIDNELL
jgi:hypothetical protein